MNNRESRDEATLLAIGRIYCEAHHQNYKKKSTGLKIEGAGQNKERAPLKIDGSGLKESAPLKIESSRLCEDCHAVIYATLSRSNNCPYDHTHNCQDCSTKCQRGEAQENIRAIMAYAAPRMLLRHPIMTLRYGIRKLRSQTR